jgi:importin subunit alpha-6/7
LENGRRRREETTTQLRKAKKEEQLMKRRQAPQPIASDVEDKQIFTKADIPSLMGVFNNPIRTPQELLPALQGFRRMLSVDTNPPVEEVIAAGAVPFFVELLKFDHDPTMVFEAAWTLTNIASTEKTQIVVDNGALPILIRLLKHGDPSVREQAAWCIGNIAGDKVQLRDQVLEGGALDGL